MDPLLRKVANGWRCVKCALDIHGRRDAETHAVFFHRIHNDFLAEDPEGNYFDLREINLRMLREEGLI